MKQASMRWLAAAFILGGLLPGAWAADVTWTTAPLTGDSDVVAPPEGATLVAAVSFVANHADGALAPVVNGVTFAQDSVTVDEHSKPPFNPRFSHGALNLVFSGGITANNNKASGNKAYTSLEAPYRALLGSAYVTAGSPSFSLALKGLKFGGTYKVIFFCQDNLNGAYDATWTSGGATVSGPVGAGDKLQTLGSSFTATFTTDAENQDFTVSGPFPGAAPLNAIEVILMP